MSHPPRRFYEFDTFRVDAAERQLQRAGKLVPLTPKVFDILLVLIENKGQTVEKEELIRKVWADTFVEEGSLNRNISTLRKALGDDSNEQRFIKTLPKRGYRFTANVEEIIEDEPLIIEKNTRHQPALNGELVETEKSSKFRFSYLLAFAAVLIGTFVLAWTLIPSAKSRIDLSRLSENERQQLLKRGSNNLQAYENYVNGRALWHQRSAEGLHQSIIHLEQAINLDPNFALAHAALADAYAFDTNKRNLAENEANEAIRLDPVLGEPHAAIGFMRMFWDWKLKEAQPLFRRAVELSPNYATAHQWYALNLVAGKLGGAALAEMKRAQEIEPNSLAINADLCQIFYFLRKYDEAIAQCRKTLEMDANFLNAHMYLYDIYTINGKHAEAVEEFFKIEQLKSDFSIPPVYLDKLRKAYTTGGIRAFWQARVEYLEQAPSYKLAQYYARLGEKEKALKSLKESYKHRAFDCLFFATDPVFADLTKERAFSELEIDFGL